MKILRYVWLIGINLLQLAIILWIYRYIYSWFETIAISLLILIYISIDSYIITNWYLESTKLIWFIEEFIALRIILKDPKLLQDYDNEKDIYDDKLEEPKKVLNNISPRFYVGAIFNFIFYIICIVNILKVIMN